MNFKSRFNKDRSKSALFMMLTAIFPLYLLVVCVAEPLRSFAAVSQTTVAQFQVTGTLSMNCSATSTLGTALGSGTAGSGALAVAQCQPNTNNALGYTLSWRINSSTGSTTPVCVGNCYGTGHLLSNNVTAGKPDLIKAFTPKLANRPERFDGNTIGTGSGSRWAARLRANSTSPGGATITWGTDSSTETFLNVTTGAAVDIAKRTSATGAQNDIENFLFKMVIPLNVFQPTGTYKANIIFTATDN